MKDLGSPKFPREMGTSTMICSYPHGCPIEMSLLIYVLAS